MPDNAKDFAVSTVATPPSPAGTGTSLVLAAGTGALFPAPPFFATISPAGAAPTAATAEIVHVTGMTGDSITAMTRHVGGSVRSVLAGDSFANTITAEQIASLYSLGTGPQGPQGPQGPAGTAGAGAPLGGSVASGATYTLRAADVNTIVWFTAACTVTIPKSSTAGGTVPWVQGQIVFLYQDFSAAQGVSVVGETGVAIASAGGLTHTAQLDSLVALIAISIGAAGDEWLMTGDRA